MSGLLVRRTAAAVTLFVGMIAVRLSALLFGLRLLLGVAADTHERGNTVNKNTYKQYKPIQLYTYFFITISVTMITTFENVTEQQIKRNMFF